MAAGWLLHVSIASEFFESIFTLFILGAPGTFGRPRHPQLFDNVAHGSSIRLDGESAGSAAQAAIALAFSVGKVKRYDRDLLTLDVFPNVQLRPVKQGMDADVGAFFEIGFELVP